MWDALTCALSFPFSIFYNCTNTERTQMTEITCHVSKAFRKVFFVKFCMRCEKFKDQALPISECQVFPAIILRNPDEYYSDQSQRKVWKSGGGVVVMLCSAPVWKRVKWFYKIGRGGRLPPWSPRSYGPVWCMGSNVSLYEIEFDFFFTNVSQFFYE